MKQTSSAFDKFVTWKYTSHIWSVAEGKVWCIHTANSDACRLCVARTMTRGRGLETSPITMHFWKSGFKFAFGRNKKGKVLGILNQLKKLSKSNDVHAQNNTFLSSTKQATITAEISRCRRWRHYVYTLMGIYVY